MKLLVTPRDANPYQELLYGPMRRRGVAVAYLGALTPSRTLNLILMPFELAWRRALGWRTVHLHWVFGFATPPAVRRPGLRRLGELMFRAWLATARVLGVRIVWTAHNALPHAPVFADDLRARRALVSAADLVIAHTESALDELRELGLHPRAAVVIPHGPMPVRPPAPAAQHPPAVDGLHLLHFGAIHPYKGVEELLEAVAELDAPGPVTVTVAGECPDPALRGRIERLAAAAGPQVRLILHRVPDAEVAALFATADAAVLPFRRITSSGSALLALGTGTPLVVPDHPAFAGLPDDGVVRYDGTVAGLAAALRTLAGLGRARLAEMGAAAAAHDTGDWDAIAHRTLVALTDGVAAPAAPRTHAQPHAGRGR